MSYNLLKGKRGIIFGALDEIQLLGKQQKEFIKRVEPLF